MYSVSKVRLSSLQLIIEYKTLMVHVKLVHTITEMDSQNHHYFYIDKANYVSFYYKSSFFFFIYE